MTNTLNKIMHDGDEYLLPEGFSPDNAGNTNDVLTKTANGYEWSAPSGGDVSGPASSTDGHLAVFDGATGKLIKDGGPIPTGDVGVSTDTGTLLSAGVDLWLGTETDFSSISTPDTNTLYIQYKSDGGGGWIPTANTIAYWELNGNGDDTKNDYGVTTYTATDYDATGYVGAGNPTYITQRKGKYCAYFDGTRAIQLPALPIPSNTVTFSCWVNLSSIEVSGNNAIFQLREDVDSANQSSWAFMFSSQNGGIAPIYISVTSSSGDSGAAGNAMNYYSINTGTWYNIVMTFNAGTAKFYVNGALIETKNSSIYLRNYHDTTPSYIGAWYSRNYSESQYITGYVQDMIYENTVWSDQDVLDYYNLTKE